MGLTAENIVEKYGISREEQDQLALLSHNRALTAVTDGTFAREIRYLACPTRINSSEASSEPATTSIHSLRPSGIRMGVRRSGGCFFLTFVGINNLLYQRMSNNIVRTELGYTDLVDITQYSNGVNQTRTTAGR